MNTGSVFLLVAAAGLAGWLAARDDNGDTAPVAAATLAVTSPAVPPGPGETALPRAADGHFYADVTIDGVPLRMLVDSGASIIALTAADADALGLDWNEDDIIPIGHGASGMVSGKRIRLDQVQLGDLAADQVDAAIMPHGLPVSLLGQSFLSRIGHVEIRDDRMLLRN